MLQEVIVTAQKRKQSINDVGMAITALSADQLNTKGVTSVATLAKVDPSFVVLNASYGPPVYSIRGINYNDNSLNASPPVTVYTDEIPYPYPILTKGAALDLQDVQVLKGPQGTLFGENATGGAINYVTAKPTDTPEAGMNLTYARFGEVDANGYMSGPLSDTVKARLSFDTTHGGAWQRSETTGASLGNKDSTKGRLLLDWDPSSNLHFALNVNGWVDNSDSVAAQLVHANPQDTYLIPALAGNPTVQSELVNLVSAIVHSPMRQTNQAADWNTGTEPKLDEHFYQSALSVEYSFTPNVQLNSITSYEHYRQNDLLMNSGLALNNNDEQQMGSINSFYQELRLSGLALGRTLHWLGGIDYENDRVTENIIGDLPQSTPAYAFTPLGLPPFSSIGIFGSTRATTKAAFGNLEYRVLPNLSLQGGARFTQSNINYNGCLYNTDNNFAKGLEFVQGAVKGAANIVPTPLGACETLNAQFNPGMVVESLDQNNVSWRFGPNWHITPNSLLYANVSKGYKAGSFPVLPGTGAIQFRPVTQESVLAFEAGYKGTLLGDTLAVDADYFHYNYKNMQLLGRILDPTGVFGVIDALVNVPQSTEDGVELSTTWHPIDGLSLELSGTYLDARVTGNFTTYDDYTGVLTNFNGYQLPNTPRFVGIASPQYTWLLTSNLIATIGATYRYQSAAESAFVSRADYLPGVYSSPGYTPGSLAIASYGVLDANAGIGAADGRWNIKLWGQNVTNKYYWSDAFHVYDTTVRYAGMPATYGVTFSFRFSGK